MNRHTFIYLFKYLSTTEYWSLAGDAILGDGRILGGGPSSDQWSHAFEGYTWSPSPSSSPPGRKPLCASDACNHGAVPHTAQKLDYSLRPLKLGVRSNLCSIKYLPLYFQCLFNHCFPECIEKYQSYKQKQLFIVEHSSTHFAISVSNVSFRAAKAVWGQLRQHSERRREGAPPHVYWLLTTQTLTPWCFI